MPNEFVCDVFAGIGPFAIPIAKKGGNIVFANDLNPDSFLYLKENIDLNGVNEKVSPFCLCGREFIEKSNFLLNEAKFFYRTNPKKKKIEKPVIISEEKNDVANSQKKQNFFSHYIMNLPATAIEFLDAFIGLYENQEEQSEIVMPIIHCYCFSNAENKEKDVIDVIHNSKTLMISVCQKC